MSNEQNIDKNQKNRTSSDGDNNSNKTAATASTLQDSHNNGNNHNNSSSSSMPLPPSPPDLPMEQNVHLGASAESKSPPEHSEEEQQQHQHQQQLEEEQYSIDIEAPLPSDDESLHLTGSTTDEDSEPKEGQKQQQQQQKRGSLMSKESFFSDEDYTDDDDDDAENFDSDGRNTDARVSQKAKEAEKERKSLSANEDRAVRRIRAISFLVLISTAVAITFGVYTIVRDGQQEAFYNEFDMGSNKILESFHQSIEQVLASFDSMSSYMTSYATTTNPDGTGGTQFPEVTFPDFEVWGANVRTLAKGAATVFYTPLVTDDIRFDWETYTASTHQHMLASYAKEGGMLAQQDAQYNISSTGSTNNRQLQDGSPYVFRPAISGSEGYFGVEAPNTGPYLPLWQSSPAIPLPGILNFNILDLYFFRGPFSTVLNTSQASLGVMSQLDDPTDENAETAAILNIMLIRGQYRHSLEKYEKDPVTLLGYPIFDNFSIPNRKIVGVLGTAFYWRLLFQDVLSETTSHFSSNEDSARRNSYIVVVKNTFGQAESFKIAGPDVTYLGPGDHYHELIELDFDEECELQKSVNVAEFISSRAGPETRSFTSVELNTDYLSYELNVYPAKEMEEEFLTNEPLVYAGVVIGIFTFTAFFFICHNYIVEARQKKVVDKAVKSTAVVKSLFPENVHQRLLNEAVGEDDTKSKKKGALKGAHSHNNDDDVLLEKDMGANSQFLNRSMDSRQLVDFMTNTASEVEITKRRSMNLTNKFTTPPIADLFEEATVFFADLAGFTKWSSGRKPTDVFGLLETIYGTFDVLAFKHDVFKVETIGDCYVAVTGVPQPQKDHAIQMTKFAVKCMYKLKHKLLPKLMEEYGHDETSTLRLRIGIHSGPVTAGVLRGERARFQLFGDTVNTAARMESNGIPGRIQISQGTADCLINNGKGHWVKPRHGTIVAKGKGEMQTYWIQSNAVKTAMTTAASVPDDAESVLSMSNHSNEKAASESEAAATRSSTASVDINHDGGGGGGGVGTRRERRAIRKGGITSKRYATSSPTRDSVGEYSGHSRQSMNSNESGHSGDSFLS